VIAGPDENGHRAKIEALSKILGTECLIQFIGPIVGNEKKDAFAASDLFVLPSLSEGAPIVVLEALGAGVPVITTQGTPWQELQTERCGWWVDVSVAGLRKALMQAISIPKSELEEMGKRGKMLVARKYTWAKTAEKTILLYNWLLGKSERPDFVIID
jgi:glycosyltransferase involved in cell wall biosynthesis